MIVILVCYTVMGQVVMKVEEENWDQAFHFCVTSIDKLLVLF